MRTSLTLAFVTFASAIAAIAQTQNSSDAPYQVRYASNLNIGDSIINVVNTGATAPARICLNTYVFDSTSEMVACCSCAVPPDAVVSYSTRNDLISNTFIQSTPASVVIKLVSTVPVANSCSSSATNLSSESLAPGMAAWGTSLRAFATTTVPGGIVPYPPVTTTTYSTTETPFTASTLSPTEANQLSSLCNAIVTTGQGFGICRSCRIGGQ